MTDIDEARKRLHHQADLADKQLASWGTVTNRISDIRAVLDALDAAERERDESGRIMSLAMQDTLRAEQERDEALAVIERAQDDVVRHHFDTTTGRAIDAILAATPTDVLRQVKAEAWDEGAKAMMRAVSEEQTVSFVAPHNPYRIEKGEQ